MCIRDSSTPRLAKGYPIAEPFSSAQAVIWFPNLGANLPGSGVGEVKNSDLYSGNTLQLMESMGRITSFDRTYTYDDLCNAPDGVQAFYIQVFFFTEELGARQFMSWATNDWTFPGVEFTNEIGTQAYLYSRNTTKLTGGECDMQPDTVTFQKANIVYRVILYTRADDENWTQGRSLDYALSIAQSVESSIP